MLGNGRNSCGTKGNEWVRLTDGSVGNFLKTLVLAAAEAGTKVLCKLNCAEAGAFVQSSCGMRPFGQR
jgi:hypothetical protein